MAETGKDESVLVQIRRRQDQAELEAKTKEIGQVIGDVVRKTCGESMGFMFVTFNFGEAGHLAYVSNANREDMIKSLRELADNLEKHPG